MKRLLVVVMVFVPLLAHAVTIDEFGQQEGDFLYHDFGTPMEEVVSYKKHAKDKKTVEETEKDIVVIFEAHGMPFSDGSSLTSIVRYRFKKPEKILVAGQAYYYVAGNPEFTAQFYRGMVMAFLEEYGEIYARSPSGDRVMWELDGKNVVIISYAHQSEIPYVLYEAISGNEEHQIEE